MVFVFRVINDDLLDLKLLPYLLGFRVGIAAKGVAAHSVLWSRAKLLLSQQPVQDLSAAVRDEVDRQDRAHVGLRKTEFIRDRLVRVGKIIPAQIIAGIHQAHDRPVEPTPGPEAFRE